MKLGGRYAIHLHKDGELFSFLPGDEVPDWAAKQIHNPQAWEEVADEPETSEPEPEPVEPAVEPQPEHTGGMPPKSGAGATRQVWADYAEAQGITVDADWKREDIIAAVEKAGH